MMAVIGAGILVVLLWAWWFDHYRRAPRRGRGRIDDTAIERDRSRGGGPSVHDTPHSGHWSG